MFWKASPVPIKDWYDVGLVMGKLTTELWLKYHATCGLRNGGWVPLTCLAATPYGTVELLLQLIHFGYSNSEHVFFGPDATTISKNALLAYQSAKASLSGVTKALKVSVTIKATIKERANLHHVLYRFIVLQGLSINMRVN